jgi:hypothetical protein
MGKWLTSLKFPYRCNGQMQRKNTGMRFIQAEEAFLLPFDYY